MKTRIIAVLAVAFLAYSCGNKQFYKADISDIEPLEVEIKRYEKILFEVNPYDLREEIEPHVEDFKLFLGDQIFTEAGEQQLFDYVTDPFVSDLYDKTMQKWSDLSKIEADLSRAFRYYRYHFSVDTLPDFYSYISGLDFEFPVKYYEGNLIIGIDMYLGKENELYGEIGIPVFKRQRFIPEGMVRDVMMQMLEKDYSFNESETLLDFMIAEGKKLYYLDCVLPELADSVKIMYTSDQMDWARQNDEQAWVYYLENDVLYDSDRQMIQKFIGSAPFTNQFGRDSSPRMGSYTGWEIVRQYMKRNPDITLQQLLDETDSRKILSESKYRP